MFIQPVDFQAAGVEGLKYIHGHASSGSIGLKLDGELSLDKLKVAKNFNSFCTIVGLKLVEKLSQSFNEFGKNFVESFYHNNSAFFQNVIHFQLFLKTKF